MVDLRIAEGEIANQQPAVADHLNDLVANLIRGAVVEPVYPFHRKSCLQIYSSVYVRSDTLDNGIVLIRSIFPKGHRDKDRVLSGGQNMIKNIDKVGRTGV